MKYRFNYWKQIFNLSIPSFVSFATATMVGTISLLIVQSLGTWVIAVVGTTNIIMYNGFAIFSGFGNTINYIVSQNYGANNLRPGIEKTYRALYLSVTFGILLFFCARFIADFGIPFFIKNAGQVEKDYVHLRLCALSLGFTNFVLHSFFRGIRKIRLSMLLSLFSNAIILFLTYALVFGCFFFPKLGLVGAGYAIVIGEIFGLTLSSFIFFVYLHPKFQTRMKVPFSNVKTLLQESIKLGLQEFSTSSSMLLFTFFVSFLGARALAVNEIALSIMAFGFTPVMAFSATATIMVGQKIGEGNSSEAKKIGTDVVIISSIFLLTLGILEVIYASNIAGLYVNPGTIEHQLVSTMIQVSAFLQILDGFAITYGGGLRGIGDTTFLYRAFLGFSWLYFVPVAYINIHILKWGSLGAWAALYSYFCLLGISTMIRFLRTDFSKIKMKN